MDSSPHSLIAWYDPAEADSRSVSLSVVLNAANITDSRLKGEKAATKPAFWMKMTLILSRCGCPFIWTRFWCATAWSVRGSTAVEARCGQTLCGAESCGFGPWCVRCSPASSLPCFFLCSQREGLWIRIRGGSVAGGGVCADLLLLLLSFLSPSFCFSSPLSHLWYGVTDAHHGRGWECAGGAPIHPFIHSHCPQNVSEIP